jgi:hypothetical protein
MKAIVIDYATHSPDRRYKDRHSLDVRVKILPRVFYWIREIHTGPMSECEEVVRRLKLSPIDVYFTAEVHVEEHLGIRGSSGKIFWDLTTRLGSSRKPKGFWFDTPKMALDAATAKEIVKLEKDLRKLKLFRSQLK